MFGWIDWKNHDAPDPDEDCAATQGILITGQAGFVGGMRVATSLGWRAAEALSVGDRVLTFDHGLQPVLDIQREVLAMPEGRLPEHHMPILIPEGALDNDDPIRVMPDQGLLVESNTVQDILDDPFAVIPARAMAGLRGIAPALPPDPVIISTIAFAEDEVVYVEGGLLAHCPRPRNILADGGDGGAYRVLAPRVARYLVACLIEDDDIRALICDHEEIVGIANRGRSHLRTVPQS